MADEDEGATPTGDEGEKPSGDEGADAGAKPEALSPEELAKAFADAGIEDPKGALDTIKKLRDFERGTKLPETVSKELEDLRGKVKAAEDAKLSAAQRKDKELNEAKTASERLEKDLADLRLEVAFERAGRKAGARYPEDVVRLIDRQKLALDDKGQPTNIDELVTELAKDRPELFPGDGTKVDYDGGARGRASGGKDMNATIREGIRR